MKSYKTIFTLGLLLFTQAASACVSCNKDIREAIFDSTFYPNLVTILAPFVVLAIVVAIISSISLKKYKTKLAADNHSQLLSPVPLGAAATVLGIGLGGFVDGIVFHQILQWHELLSNKFHLQHWLQKV